MILLLSQTTCYSANELAKIFLSKKIPFFRFNADMFDRYSFLWNDNGFEIKDPLGNTITSKCIDYLICYKSLLSSQEEFLFKKQFEDVAWVRMTINVIIENIIRWGEVNGKLKLFCYRESLYPKTLQMELAKKFFTVPSFNIFWKQELKDKNVISKTLIQKAYQDSYGLYAKKVNQALLDPQYPWFTQDIAEGDRDATIVYVNGKVYCYCFATTRGKMTDWRITQGSEKNQWITWNAEKDFKEKVILYMNEIGLKFGRLDFIIGGKEPQFLEVNPCGQFGWLDDENLTLHNEVVDAILDPSSTITL